MRLVLAEDDEMISRTVMESMALRGLCNRLSATRPGGEAVAG